jgi:hypothetical protein
MWKSVETLSWRKCAELEDIRFTGGSAGKEGLIPAPMRGHLPQSGEVF